jgi:hypothetical protein
MKKRTTKDMRYRGAYRLVQKNGLTQVYSTHEMREVSFFIRVMSMSSIQACLRSMDYQTFMRGDFRFTLSNAFSKCFIEIASFVPFIAT